MYEFEMLSEVLIRFRNVSFLFMILLSLLGIVIFAFTDVYDFPFNVRVRPVFWKACIHEKLPPKERFSL